MSAERAAVAQAFLRSIFPTGVGGYLELRAKCPRDFITQHWYQRDALPPMASFLRRHDDCAIWFGVATRAKKGSGAAHNCVAVFSTHLDADCKTPERAAEFKAALAAFPLPPAIIVKTGSPFSWHVYWKLAEPLSLADGDNSNRYTRVVSGLARHFGTDPSVADVARVMRLPGSRNTKPEAGGALVSLTYLNAKVTHPLDAFTPWIAAPESPTPPVPSRTAEDRDPEDPDYVDLVAEFGARGWLREDQGDGMWFVTCPWAEQHSSYSGPSESALWEYGGRWHFKCQHAHCAKRRVAAAYEFFRLARSITSPILIGGGDRT